MSTIIRPNILETKMAGEATGDRDIVVVAASVVVLSGPKLLLQQINTT